MTIEEIEVLMYKMGFSYQDYGIYQANDKSNKSFCKKRSELNMAVSNSFDYLLKAIKQYKEQK